jgi:hypothetical protein
MQSPSTQLPPTMIHQRHANDESQAVQSPSTLQPTLIIQQANASEPQAARWVYGGYVPPAKRRKMTYGLSSLFVGESLTEMND